MIAMWDQFLLMYNVVCLQLNEKKHNAFILSVANTFFRTILCTCSNCHDEVFLFSLKI